MRLGGNSTELSDSNICEECTERAKKDSTPVYDRHDSLGASVLGMGFFERLMQDKRFDNIPLILETPNENLWPQEIEKLYGMTFPE